MTGQFTYWEVDLSEKTEPPSGKKLAEARSEGRVARSQELNTAAALLMSVYLLRGPGARLVEDLKNMALNRFQGATKAAMRA